MGWKFFGPTADSGESAVGVCRGSPTADAIFEFVKGSFVVSFERSVRFKSFQSVRFKFFQTVRTERDGAVKETTKEPFTNSKIGSAVDRLPWRLSGMGLRKMFGKEISRWFWDLDHQENLPWKISAETLRTGLRVKVPL